jgi:hypothetical protein
MKKEFTICFVLLLIGAGATTLARSQTQGRSSQDRRSGAVTLLRVINTAEMEQQMKQRHFGTFAELVESGSLDAAGKRFGNTWSALSFDRKATSEPLAGYAMHFTLDAAGKAYSVSLTDKSDDSSFFTDERGLIYEAKPLQ